MGTFNSIQQKWQKKWEQAGIFKSKISSKKKFYCLEMFPYPSASYLHMGHVRNYTIGDVIARFKRMQGYNVLYPMGYDSFGLPAENASKKEGIHPKVYTEKAIAKIIEYQKALGNSYDWSRKIATHEPEYFRWNQYFFLKFIEKGLVYKKKAPVNWCPSCNSVLANEEVVNGKCWRHEDTDVIQKELEQWFLKTTAYADELLADIEKLQWSDRIKNLQRNWIGGSEGCEILFEINGKKWPIFTTRADTIFGVTFMVIGPQHPKLREFVTPGQKKKVDEFLNEINSKDITNKEGVFTGSYAKNPLTEENVPIWVGNFVDADYGSGMIMAVPAHDQKDFEFAKKYKLPIKQVIGCPNPPNNHDWSKGAYTDDGNLINSGQFNSLRKDAAKEKIIAELSKKRLAKKIINYKLRDWLISRQRYWGTPIPIVYCDKCGTVPLDEEDLPLKLPEKVDFKVSGNPLSYVKEWVKTKCPKCNAEARRETDTMGGFVDSSWYFLRFCSPNNSKFAFEKDEVKYWMPVDQYIGGIEHAVGHLIYSRFFTKVLRDMKLLNFDEPFTRLFNQGIVHKDGHKMSKSFGNVVMQTEISEKYGIDTARIFLMAVAHPESDMEWSDKGVEGSFRFLQKVSKLSELETKEPTRRDEHKRNLTIKNYTGLLEQFKFNLAIIELIKYADYLMGNLNKPGYEDLLKMLSPFAPHTAEELWSLTHKDFISIQPWPKLNGKAIDEELEFESVIIDTLRSDINTVLELAEITKPNKITLLVASKWKYDFVKKLKQELEKTQNAGEIIKSIMSTSLKKYGQEITKLIPNLIKDRSKIPKSVFTQDKEFTLVTSLKEKLEKDFAAEVEVVKAEESKEQKAKNAMPGKVAIIVS